MTKKENELIETIPEMPVLQFMALRDEPMGHCCDPACSCSVANAMPKDTTEAIVRLKMAHMMSKGLVVGCPCGCRGNW